MIQQNYPIFFPSVLNLSWMCFEHECFVNHSLGIKGIWFQKYLGPKHFGSKSILIQTYFPKFFEYVRNVFWTWMFEIFWFKQIFKKNWSCFEFVRNKRNLVPKIFGTITFWVKKYFDPNIFSKIFLNLSGICFEHECYVNHSLGLKEIWFKRYLGPKTFWVKKYFDP